MAQITSVTSESLQAEIRRLLPSQQGFGEDLQASNVITPIIDLTPTAEGSEVRQDLQTALSHGSNTAFDVINSTDTLVTTTGFYRVFGGLSIKGGDSTAQKITFQINDGSTNKNVYRLGVLSSSAVRLISENVDFVVFLGPGDSLKVVCDSQCRASGSTRQIADVNGNLVNPVGFTPS